MTDPDRPLPLSGAADGASVEWPQGRFEGRQLFRDVVIQGMACAAACGSRTLWLCDPDFAAWPLGERACAAALDAWCRQTRDSPVAQVRVLGQSFDDMRLRHGRFVQWRALWSHRVQVRAWPAGLDSLPGVLWTPEWTLQRVDPDRDIVVATTDPVQRTRVGERLQQWWQTARPAFPDRTLGL